MTLWKGSERKLVAPPAEAAEPKPDRPEWDNRLPVASEDSRQLAERSSRRAEITDLDVAAGGTEHERIVAARLRHLVPADQPLVLITQAPRSGGTLLMRLFDSHPQCHVFPHEMEGLLAGDASITPDPDQPWMRAFERRLGVLLDRGYRQAMPRLNFDRDSYPILIPPLLQRRIFAALTANLRGESERDVLDLYVTAYFNAWLDNRNLYVPEEKRWVVGFAPGLITNRKAMRRFESEYPDGRLISVIRDPWSWYLSARRWSPRWQDLDQAIKAWKKAAKAGRLWAEAHPETARIVTFERLLRATRKTIRSLAGWLEIENSTSLTTPTTNAVPVKSNSSFTAKESAVDHEPLERYKELLSSEEIERIDELAAGAYRKVARLSVPRGTGRMPSG
jgi:Sulfotransferase family